jgi:hypothetical protein
MKRKIYSRMLEWKKTDQGTSCLLIQGARRVGKSYIAEEFARIEYKSYILIDFNQAGQNVRELFLDDLNDLDTFFLKLSAEYNTKLYPRESVIILDEVQLYPRARSALKYLVADGRYDYIETGSLISIKKNVENILLPSEEEQVNMYPMDFEEFLWALGNETMMPLIRACFDDQKELGQALHRKAMNLFRQYMIIGGMPQVVSEFAQSRNLEKVDRIKRRILQLYRDDIHKHGGTQMMRIEGIYDEIPSQLRNQKRHFKLSAVEENARFSEFRDPLFWLADAMIVNNCYNSTEPSVGLKMNQDRTLLKCYMGDTGLLISHAFDENGIVSEEIYRKLLMDKLEVNMGMVVENVVAQMLVCSGHKLYFYANSDQTNKENRMEIDFLISKKTITNRHNISPIEVKSSRYYTLSSLRKFIAKYDEQLHIPYVIHPGELKTEEGITYIPLYMASLI